MSLSKYMMIALLVALGISSGAAFLLFKQNQTLHENVATEKANVQTAIDAADVMKKTVLRQEAHMKESSERLQLIAKEMVSVQIEKDEAIQTLNLYRSRIQNAALGRPTLVGRMASRASAKVFADIFLVTGGNPLDTDENLDTIE